MNGLRVLVAEDDVAVQKTIVALLTPEFQVGTVGNGEQLGQAAIRFQPDVIVSDLSMPSLDSLLPRQELLSRGINIPFVFVTITNIEVLPFVVEEGPVGYVHKTDLLHELKFGVRAVALGFFFFSRSFREDLQSA